MAAARLGTAFLLGCALAACEDTPPEPAGRYDIEPETGQVTASARFEGGEATMVSGRAITAPLPVDLPILPGAEVIEATHVTATNGMRRALVRLSTDASPSEAMAFYRNAATQAGLSEAIDLEGPAGATYIAVGPGRERVSIHVGRREVDAESGAVVPGLTDDEDRPGSRDPAGPGQAATRAATIVSISLVAPPLGPSS